MSEKTRSEKTEPASERNSANATTETRCPKCKGSGVIFTNNFFNQRVSIPCDQCVAGNRVSSRMQELIEGVDRPGPSQDEDDGAVPTYNHIWSG
jgi:excinuclease UvrABC ATPase subunit